MKTKDTTTLETLRIRFFALVDAKMAIEKKEMQVQNYDESLKLLDEKINDCRNQIHEKQTAELLQELGHKPNNTFDKEYDEGYNAGQNRTHENPYSEGTAEYSAWEEGWEVANQYYIDCVGEDNEY